MAPQTTEAKADGKRYDQDSIQVKEGIEHVRARPAMYIGDVYERGLHHLVSEVVDNSIDEAMAGYCTEISVTLHEDGAITILDNGRGIPVGIHKKVGKPTLEVCLTVLGAGGKFDKDSYKVSGGLHGVGVSCVNALSEWLEATVYRDGKEYRMRFERGRTTKELEEVGPTQRRGTKITFKPDDEIFRQGTRFDYDTIASRLRELAYLNAGLKITLCDERGDEERSEVFHFPKGLREFVAWLATSEENLLREPVFLKGRVDSPDSGGAVEVEIALQYQDTYNETIATYTNNINTIEGGTHLTGFRTALTSSMNAWLKENKNAFKKLKEDERPSGDDYREGLVAVISVRVPEPQFEGQTKTKLGNSDVAGIVQSVVGQHLRAWCEQRPAEAKKIVGKALQARKARIAARRAKDLVRMRKDALGGGGVAKLKNCDSKKPEECELYLVEGDSAGGTATDARDPRTQAILPLRGKILNVWKATHEKMLSHQEIATIIQVLETGVLADFDLSKLRYHKIIIMCDADVDGSHIRTLILTFFFRQMPELISAGHVYLAQPPLFKVTPKGKRRKKGESEDAHSKYLMDAESLEQELTRLGLEGTRLVRSQGEGLEASGEELERLIATVKDVLRVARDLEKKQIELRAYLARQKEGRLPFARVHQPGGKGGKAVYSEEELDEWLRAARERKPDLKVWSPGDPLEERPRADFEIVRFKTPKQKLEAALAVLGEYDLGWEDLFAPEQQQGEELVHPFALVRGSEREALRSLADLPAAVETLGQRGVEVQRYKGLGEMDADELEETTMKPGKRVLVRVTIDDMAGANKMFSTLMGSKVEPRRNYIEEHALSVAADELDA
ncbi:MAG: DNA gyrase subunit B [Planctomycetota bacterium]|nr:MAG: DNA gyrase subunit B [Planctomycetota bacterium]